MIKLSLNFMIPGIRTLLTLNSNTSKEGPKKLLKYAKQRKPI